MGSWGYLKKNQHDSLVIDVDIEVMLVYFSVPQVIYGTPHGLMESMDFPRIPWTYNKSNQTLEKDKWSPWILENFHGVHGL